MKIITDTCILRDWQPSDDASLSLHANNINVWNNVRDYFPHPYTLYDAKEYIGMVRHQAMVCDFAIVVAGNAVGGIGFVPGYDVERLNAEVGYWLGEPYWHKGIMQDAVAALVQHVFEHTPIIRLFAPVYEFNIASMRVLEKVGFHQLAIMRDAAVKNGKVLDLYYYELLKNSARQGTSRIDQKAER